MDKQKKIVYATIVLKSAKNKNILGDKALLSKDIGGAKASQGTVVKALTELKKMGFSINGNNDFMVSISGNKSLFESAFKMEMDELQINNDTFYKAIKKEIPVQLKNIIEDVVFSEPMELF